MEKRLAKPPYYLQLAIIIREEMFHLKSGTLQRSKKILLTKEIKNKMTSISIIILMTKPQLP